IDDRQVRAGCQYRVIRQGADLASLKISQNAVTFTSWSVSGHCFAAKSTAAYFIPHMPGMFDATAKAQPSLALCTGRRTIRDDLIDHGSRDIVFIDSRLQSVLLVVAALLANAGQVEGSRHAL